MKKNRSSSSSVNAARSVEARLKRAEESAKLLGGRAGKMVFDALEQARKQARRLVRSRSALPLLERARKQARRVSLVGKARKEVLERARKQARRVSATSGKKPVSAVEGRNVWRQREKRLSSEVSELQDIVLKQAAKIAPSRAARLQMLMHSRYPAPPTPFRRTIELPASMDATRLRALKRVAKEQQSKLNAMSLETIQKIVARRGLEPSGRHSDRLSKIPTSVLRQFLERSVMKGQVVSSGLPHNKPPSRRELMRASERAMRSKLKKLKVTATKPHGLILAPKNGNDVKLPSVMPPDARSKKKQKKEKKQKKKNARGERAREVRVHGNGGEQDEKKEKDSTDQSGEPASDEKKEESAEQSEEAADPSADNQQHNEEDHSNKEHDDEQGAQGGNSEESNNHDESHDNQHHEESSYQSDAPLHDESNNERHDAPHEQGSDTQHHEEESNDEHNEPGDAHENSEK